MTQHRYLLALAGISLIVLLIFFGFFSFSTSRTPVSGTDAGPVSDDVTDASFTLTGAVWTSGLMAEEQDQLGISSDYQLVKPSAAELQKGWNTRSDGMYLVSTAEDLNSFLGKCVSVTGSLYPGWENLESNNYEINGKWTYGRSAMLVRRIAVVAPDNCYVIYPGTPVDSQSDLNSDYKTFSGVLGFAQRPAPDISYDLKIILDKPFKDIYSSTGQSELASQLDISPRTTELYLLMLGNIGRQVEIGGYVNWGYAESWFLSVDRLKLK